MESVASDGREFSAHILIPTERKTRRTRDVANSPNPIEWVAHKTISAIAKTDSTARVLFLIFCIVSIVLLLRAPELVFNLAVRTLPNQQRHHRTVIRHQRTPSSTRRTPVMRLPEVSSRAP